MVVAFQNGDIAIGIYSGGGIYRSAEDDFFESEDYGETVIAWIPKLEPPKEEKNE